MPLNLPSLKKILTGGITEAVKTVADVVDRFKLTGEEKAAIDQAVTDALNKHTEKMAELAIKEIELDNADRDSARKREEAFVKATGRADWFQYFIGTAAVLGMFPLLYYVLKYEIPQRNEHIVLLLLGELIGVVVSIYGYHYGSSAGSRFKDMKK